MQNRRLSRSSIVLIGIGLVLVGLLTGILAMLAVLDGRAVSTNSPTSRIAEQVQLGAREPVVPVSVPHAEPGETDRDVVEAPVVVPDLLALNSMFKQVAERITPAVVYIQVEGPPAREWLPNFEEDDPHRRFFRDMPRQSVGSGVIISDDGYVITNNHVISGATEIQVTLEDRRQFEAEVVGTDPSTDLAVLQLETNGEAIPVVALGDSDQLGVGEWVLAVGNPFRLTSTVTAGIVSALGRQVDIIEHSFRIEDFIQTDAAINPGNSGGALVNLQGELVGINTAIATETGSYEGYGFAVPVNLMERVATDLIAYGEVQRGMLGVEMLPITARAAQQLGLAEIGGVYIHEAHSSGAAYEAGMRSGDVILSIDGEGVNAPNELQRIIAQRRPGEQVNVEVWREGDRRFLQVELMGRDAPAFQAWMQENEAERELFSAPRNPTEEVFELSEWGLGVRELNRLDRSAFSAQEGVYVAYVQRRSAAAIAGLPRDVVVETVGDQVIATVEDLVEQLAYVKDAEEAVLFRVRQRNGLVAFYEIEVPVP